MSLGANTHLENGVWLHDSVYMCVAKTRTPSHPENATLDELRVAMVLLPTKVRTSASMPPFAIDGHCPPRLCE